MKTLPRFHEAGAVDGDGHILEPPDTWERYIDPKHRDVVMAVRKDGDGPEDPDVGRGPAAKSARKRR